jgi:hypothetical protein
MATQQGDLQMRFSIRILAMLVVLPVVLSKAPANALPYDPFHGAPTIRQEMVAAAQIAVSSQLSNAGRP